LEDVYNLVLVSSAILFPANNEKGNKYIFVSLLPCFLFLDFDSRDLIHECKIFSLYGTNFVIATNIFPRKQYHRW